jgi:hypothetical protein
MDRRRLKGPHEGTVMYFACIYGCCTYEYSKVLLPALQGHIPSQMIASISSFLDFCYLIRRDMHTDTTLNKITSALTSFHELRQIFVDAGMFPDGISLPRQHSLVHYRPLIELFGSPNGLCSSITESKHIKAVKEPWRRSNRYKALGQILVTNQRIEKLASIRAEFHRQNLLDHDAASAEVMALEAATQLLAVDDHSSSGNIALSSKPYLEDVAEIRSGVEENPIGSEDSNRGGVDVDSELVLGAIDGTRLDAHTELARQRSALFYHTD